MNYQVLLSSISNLVLYLLVAMGLYGAMALSYSTIFGVTPCPSLVKIPVCFVVATGYLAMAFGLVLEKTRSKLSTKVFLSGWTVVFSIAIIGTLMEVLTANTCPINKLEIPLCFVSLVVTLLILLMYMPKLRDR